MKQAVIYYKDILAGVLTESDDGYEFRYLPEYLASENAKPVSLTLPLQNQPYRSNVLFPFFDGLIRLTLPLQNQPYRSNVLFPFFDGLIPEGWLLDVALRNTDISVLDRMSLLLLCCSDCIGAVSVKPVNMDGNDDV